MNINVADLIASLNIMWKGMAGLFVVCGFVALFTMVISKVSSKGKKQEPQI